MPNSIDRRTFLKTAGFLGLSTFPVFAFKKQITKRRQDADNLNLLLATRNYHGLAGADRIYPIKLDVGMPVLSGSNCWTTTYRISGLSGGDKLASITSSDSIASILGALDDARQLFMVVPDKVIWTQVSDNNNNVAANFGLPIGLPKAPVCAGPAPKARQSADLEGRAPQPVLPRIEGNFGNLKEIIALRDFDRTDDHGNLTLVRLLLGRPVNHNGRNQLLSTTTFQIQGLQPAPNTDFKDGIVTRTGFGIDDLDSLHNALTKVLGVIRNTSEGASGNLTWRDDPSDPNWGLPDVQQVNPPY